MGKIKKILEKELTGGTQNTDIYPITSTKAVYDENNERLDNVLGDLKAKIDTNSIISVHRADVSINKNVVTLGAGYYYFYKHDGVERNKTLTSPLTFTFSADKVLTFNLSSQSFQFHDKNETSSDEVILLIWDNGKGFANNYGTLWGNKIDNARINEIEQKVNNSSSVPSFVKNEANTTYSRLLDFLSGDNADFS